MEINFLIVITNKLLIERTSIKVGGTVFMTSVSSEIMREFTGG